MKKRVVKIDWSAITKEYQDLRPIAERFCVEISNQLNALVSRENLYLGFPIECRVKKMDSIQSKVERLAIHIKSVQDLQDIIGVRLIFLFQRDVEKACELIAQKFRVIKIENTGDRLKADQFGYSSMHYIIQFPDAWLSLPSLSELGGLKAEIQVRTVAQHIWAATSHILQYKKESSVPIPVRRAIHRASALLETVDLEFERMLEQREQYRGKIDTFESDEELNVDLLERVLDECLPMKNKEDNDEKYADLLQDLNAFNVNTISKLKNTITKHIKKVIAADKKQVKELIGNDDLYDENPDRILNRKVFFTHVGLARQAMFFEYGEDFNAHLIGKCTAEYPDGWESDDI